MSERPHDRISKHYASPSRTSALKKPAMRISPRKVTSPQIYRIPPRRLESPNFLKRNERKLQDATEIPSYLQTTQYNAAVNSVTSYTSPLKPRNQDNDITSSYPQLMPDTSKTISPRREIPIDTSPMRGRNIISKLKQEMSMIEALDKSPRVKREGETKKSVRFDIPSKEERNISGVVVKVEEPTSKLGSSSEPSTNNEIIDIKKMLNLIIKKQETQDLLLKEILQRQNKLEEQLFKK